MRKKFLLFLTTFLSVSFTFLLVSSESKTNQEGNSIEEESVPNEVLVRFKKDVQKNFIQNAILSVQGEILTYLGKEINPFLWDPYLTSHRSFLSDPDLFHLKVPEAVGTELAIWLLMRSPYVQYAEKNRILHVFRIPNDTHWSKLWGMRKIDADDAWDIFTGSSNVVVAVIDTGVDYNHDDLSANIWTNPGESGNGKETNGIDDDGNGYIDDFRGWDFYDNDNDPMDEYTPQEGKWYHGTHVSGIIGAVGNNNKGVAGVNWEVRIMCLKVSDENGDIPVSKAINAIDYATENGAHLSNNSYGWLNIDPDFQSYYSALYNAVDRAKNAGKLFVAAAGNCGANNFEYGQNLDNPEYYLKIYPACYTLPNIISVAASDDYDDLAWYTNYGITSVDLAAPGGRYEDDE